MANHKPNDNYDGSTYLSAFWQIVKSNFASIFNIFNGHANGTSDRHTADQIDIEGTTVENRFLQSDQEGKALENAVGIRVTSDVLGSPEETGSDSYGTYQKFNLGQVDTSSTLYGGTGYISVNDQVYPVREETEENGSLIPELMDRVLLIYTEDSIPTSSGAKTYICPSSGSELNIPFSFVDNVLLKNNVAVYTPTQDYNPATKKYVDNQITTYGIKDAGELRCNGASGANLNDVMEDSVADIKDNGIYNLVVIYVDSGSLISENCFLTVCILDSNPDSGDSVVQEVIMNSARWKRSFKSGAWSAWTYDPKVNGSNILTKNNTMQYTPTHDYNPATKEYVDGFVKKPKTHTITIDTPVWTNQPTIEGDLNPAFVDWKEKSYWVVLKDTSGGALPENQFKLTETRDDYANAVDQIFTLSGLDTGNSGKIGKYSIIDFKMIDGNSFEMRSGGVTSVNSPSELHSYKKTRFSIMGYVTDGYLTPTFFPKIPPSEAGVSMLGIRYSTGGYLCSTLSENCYPRPDVTLEATEKKSKFFIKYELFAEKNDKITGFFSHEYVPFSVKSENNPKSYHANASFIVSCRNDYIKNMEMKIKIVEFGTRKMFFLNGTEITWEVFE